MFTDMEDCDSENWQHSFEIDEAIAVCVCVWGGGGGEVVLLWSYDLWCECTRVKYNNYEYYVSLH